MYFNISKKRRKLALLSIFLLVLCVGLFLLNNRANTTFQGEKYEGPARDEIDESYKWKLEDIYLSDNLWENDFQKLKSMIEEIKTYEGKLSTSYDNFKRAILLNEKILRLGEKLNVYAGMRKNEDTLNKKYFDMEDRIEGLLTEASEATAFLEPEILKIDKSRLMKYSSEPELRDYKNYFKWLLERKNNAPTKAEEKILALADELDDIPVNFYESFQYMTEFEVNNKTASSLLSNDRKKRREALIQAYGKVKTGENILASALAAEVKMNIFNAKARNFKSPLEMALEDDGVTLEEYRNVIKTTNENLEPLHRWIALRKKILKIDDKVRLYDLYMPLIEDNDEYIDFVDAQNTVLNALKPLGEQYVRDLKWAFEHRWIDVAPTRNKYQGDYTWGSYDTHPYILLNYYGNMDSVSTIAHELGHAMNSYYTNKTQPYIKSQISTYNAEIASTTNEVLLYEYLLKNAKSKEEKKRVLYNYLRLIENTIYTQIMYAEFEEMIHEAGLTNKTIDAEFLKKTWADVMEKYYGKDFEIEDKLDVDRLGWADIQHFYQNFYVYKYATGFSAGSAFADKILKNNIKDREKYIDFLSSGSSDKPLKLLEKAGVNMHTTEPIKEVLKKFDKLELEFEKLIEDGK